MSGRGFRASFVLVFLFDPLLSLSPSFSLSHLVCGPNAGTPSRVSASADQLSLLNQTGLTRGLLKSSVPHVLVARDKGYCSCLSCSLLDGLFGPLNVFPAI